VLSASDKGHRSPTSNGRSRWQRIWSDDLASQNGTPLRSSQRRSLSRPISLEVALEDGGAAILKVALGSSARSKGMAEIAEKTGVSRQALYRALSPEENSNLSTLIGVIKALGHVVPA
jgi:probable addiction module antidote protein